MPRHHPFRGFTLIELLVVVAIIAALIAILLPSMTKARETAKMAVDGSNLRQIAIGANTYAAANKITYPTRDAYAAGGGWGTHHKPTIVCKGADDRPKIKPYFPLSGVGNCPFSPVVTDFDSAPATDQIETDYAMYFGHALSPLDPDMRRMGDAMTYNGEKFHVIASDWETIDSGWPFVESSHDSGGANPAIAQGGGVPFWIDRWDLPTASRPPVNFNFAFTDASVQAIYRITTDDDRLRRVPSSRDDNPAVRWSQLPANH